MENVISSKIFRKQNPHSCTKCWKH